MKSLIPLLLFLSILMTVLVPGATWADERWIEEPLTLASPHPYPNDLQGTTYRVYKTGASSIRLYFDYLETEPGWDHVDLHDAKGKRHQQLSGFRAGFWSDPIPGDTIILRFWSDHSISGNGFQIRRMGYRRIMRPGPEPICIHCTRGIPARLSILLRKAGGATRPLAPEQRIALRVDGERPSSFEFDIAGFAACGHELAHPSWRFRPEVTMPGTYVHGKIQSVGDNRFRFTTGRRAVRNLPVTLYDPRWPAVTTSFRVDITETQKVAPTLHQIVLFHIHPGGTLHRIQPSERIRLHIASSPSETSFDFVVWGYDRSGRRLNRFEFKPRILLPGSRVFATLESLGRHTYRFHAGPIPSRGLTVSFRDLRWPSVEAQFTVDIIEPRITSPRRPPSPQALSYVQIGSFTNPEWASRKIAQEALFSVPRQYQKNSSFRIVPDKEIEIEHIRIWIEGQTNDTTILRGPIRVPAGQAYEFTTPNIGDQKIWRIGCMQRMHRAGHTRLYVRSSGSRPVALSFVQIGRYTNPEWASRKIAQEAFFSVPQPYQKKTSFRIVTDKRIDLDHIRIWISGQSDTPIIVNGPLRIEPNNPYHFSTPNRPDQRLLRIGVMQRMHREGHIALSVRTP